MTAQQNIGYANNPYGTQAIMTASPCELVAKLYAAAINNLRKAIDCIERNDIEGRWKAGRKAFDIIEHLTLTLNTQQGGEIAENLSQLYRFMMKRMLDIDVKNDPQAARDVIVLLEPLHKSWAELARRTAGQGSGASTVQPPAQPAKASAVPGDRVAAMA
jgi:flagellar protein FliS